MIGGSKNAFWEKCLSIISKKEKKLHHKWSHFQRERKVVEASESETTALFIWSSKVRNNHISVAILNQGLLFFIITFGKIK